MRRFWLPLLALLSSLVFSPAVFAQAADQAQTVSVCGTPNNTPVVGNVYALTMDTTAKLCTSGGGGSGGNVTITAPLGSLAPAAGMAVTLDTIDAANLAGPIPAGTNSIGTVGLNAGSNAIGSITNTGFGVTTSTAGGATPFHVLSAASNNATLVSTGVHTLYSLVIAGTNTAIGDVRIYDSASSPTCSSATGVILNFPVITTSGLEGGLVVPIPAQGIVLANGLSYCITGAVADNDNTNAPTGINVNGAYK